VSEKEKTDSRNGSHGYVVENRSHSTPTTHPYARAHTHTHTHTQRSPHLGADRNEGERICDECGTRRRRGERWGGRKKQRGIVNIVEPRGANSHVVSLSTYAGHSCACARARVCVCVCVCVVCVWQHAPFTTSEQIIELRIPHTRIRSKDTWQERSKKKRQEAHIQISSGFLCPW
jgi:hypothetical protein